MTENSGSSFEPLSDEQLARLLEEQMRALRGEPTPARPEAEISAPVYIAEPDPIFEPAVEEAFPSVEEEEEEDEGIAALFGALLEDTSEVELVTEVVVAETVVAEAIDFDSLGHTQPITYLSEEVVTAAVVDDRIVVEDTRVEEVFSEPVIFDDVVVEDAHLIAARVISEISIDGEVVATTVAASAGSEPIPLMFGEVSEVVAEPALGEPTPGMAEVVTTAVVADAVLSEPVFAEPLIAEPVTVSDAAAPAFYTPVVEEEYTQVVTEEFTPPVFRSSSPVSSFAPRPSFDELVFGVSAED
ncbi:MAG: hypothetical protein RLZZ52_669 [Actinomycetota bacterium]